MSDEPLAPRAQRGWALREALREDLELHAVGELEERIALLQAEIERTRSSLEAKRKGRAAADALFSLRQS